METNIWARLLWRSSDVRGSALCLHLGETDVSLRKWADMGCLVVVMSIQSVSGFLGAMFPSALAA